MQDDAILLQQPKFFSLLFSCANCYFNTQRDGKDINKK